MGFLTVLIYVILSFIVGSILVGLSIEVIDLGTFFIYLEKEILSDTYLKVILFLAGAILILLCLRYVQASFRRSRKNKSITFESPEGKVTITLFAIEDMLKKMLEERTEVSHIKPKVFLKKKAIYVVTRGVLMAEVNLVEFTKEIQENVREKIHTLLGEDKPVHVNLEIRKVALGGQKGVVEDQEPEIPFRNYD